MNLCKLQKTQELCSCEYGSRIVNSAIKRRVPYLLQLCESVFQAPKRCAVKAFWRENHYGYQIKDDLYVNEILD